MDRWIFDRKKQSQINTTENTDEIQSEGEQYGNT